MIGEVERFFDESVDVGRLPITDAAARMRKHALDDAVSTAAVLSDLLEIAGQHPDDFVELSAVSSPSDATAGAVVSLSSSSNSTERPASRGDWIARQGAPQGGLEPLARGGSASTAPTQSGTANVVGFVSFFLPCSRAAQGSSDDRIVGIACGTARSSLLGH